MGVDTDGGFEIEELRAMWQSAPVPRSSRHAFEPSEPSPEVGSAARSTDKTETPQVPLDRLEAQICALASRIAISCALWLLLIAEFDERKGWAQWGVKSCAHWLAWSCSVSPGAAREYVRVARDLRTMPLVSESFAAGRLSYSKVRAITRVGGRVEEKTLLEQALMHTASQLERVVNGYQRAQGAGLAQQHKRRANWFWDEDGMLVLRARLPADEGCILLAALQSAEHSLGVPADDVADETTCRTGDTEPSGISRPVGGADDRALSTGSQPDEIVADLLGGNPGQVSAADALVALAHQALAAGSADSSGDDRQMLVLHADSKVFSQPAGAADDPAADGPQASSHGCRIENGPGVESDAAMRLACDAALVAALWSSHGTQGEMLSLGRKTRRISAALRRALRIRDGGCQFPGCHRRRHLQAHHVVHWMHGGPTDLNNLVLLCRAHHMLLHEGGFQVNLSEDHAEWVFRRPDGVIIPHYRPLDPDPHAGMNPEYATAATSGAGLPADWPSKAEPSVDLDGWWPTREHDLDGVLEDADRIRPGWRGERFSLADSVGVWCQATEVRESAAVGGPS